MPRGSIKQTSLKMLKGHTNCLQLCRIVYQESAPVQADGSDVADVKAWEFKCRADAAQAVAASDEQEASGNHEDQELLLECALNAFKAGELSEGSFSDNSDDNVEAGDGCAATFVASFAARAARHGLAGYKGCAGAQDAACQGHSANCAARGLGGAKRASLERTEAAEAVEPDSFSKESFYSRCAFHI
jgi:hypothetical protein